MEHITNKNYTEESLEYRIQEKNSSEKKVSLVDIASRVKLPQEGEIPRVILFVGPSRTGTTAQLRSFGETGIPAHSNPFKFIVRGLETGEDRQFELPSIEKQGSTIFIKTSLGAEKRVESELDPLTILLLANFPPDKLSVIVNMRDSLSTLTSWYKKYETPEVNRETLMENFLIAHDTTFNIYQKAKNAGIDTTAFVYEALRDNDPTLVMRQLFSRLSLNYSDRTAKGWEPIGDAENLIPTIHLYRSNPTKSTRLQGAKVLETRGLEYSKTPNANIDKAITNENVNAIAASSIPTHYERLRIDAMGDLHLPIRKTDEIKSYKDRNRKLGGAVDVS